MREETQPCPNCFSKSQYFPRILRTTVPAHTSIVLKDLQELVNQSWEYNQFSYPGKEKSEMEISDVRINGSSEHCGSHCRRDLGAERTWGEEAGRSNPVSLCL